MSKKYIGISFVPYVIKTPKFAKVYLDVFVSFAVIQFVSLDGAPTAASWRPAMTKVSSYFGSSNRFHA